MVKKEPDNETPAASNRLSYENFVLNNFYSRIYKEPIEFDKMGFKGLNISIQRVSSIRYLGVEIDYNLSFKGHLGRLQIRAEKGVETIYRLQHLFPYEILRLLYFSLVHSH